MNLPDEQSNSSPANLPPARRTPLRRLLGSLQRDGVATTAAKLVLNPWRAWRHRRFMRRFAQMQSTEEKFTLIYRLNHWGSKESVSGPGSELGYTANLRQHLPQLVEDFGIRAIFDAPCGDFNWMSQVLPQLGATYTGGDIVLPMIESHQARHARDGVSFIHLDLTRDAFPRADLMICRDCLFHLSFDDTRRVLGSFVASGTPYLLTTTHVNRGFGNGDIATGGFRLIDLFAAPYHFPQDALRRIDDWIPPAPERMMCLWSRDQVVQALAGFDRDRSTAA